MVAVGSFFHCPAAEFGVAQYWQFEVRMVPGILSNRLLTRGSTQDEVLSVQGTPTEIDVWESF